MPDDRNAADLARRAGGRRVRVVLASLIIAVLVAAGVSVVTAPAAAAHGWVGGTVVSRAAATQNADRGSVANEPQSLEAPKGFPAGGPADGKLASAGGLFGGVLDQQTATRWWKNPVAAGPLTVTWQYTAPHKTSQWRYFLTKPGWDPNAPLTRSELELIATVPHDGSAASNNPSHTITIPADRSGYQILYAVWDVADTSNAFYNTIDLDVGGTNPTTAIPTTGSISGSSTATSNGSTTSPTVYPTPTSEHTHSHPETTTSAPPSSATVATTPSVTTAPVTTAPVTTAPTTTGPTAPAWNPSGSYRIGDRVTHQGREYVCRQNHRGWGDPSWITALALWTPA